MGRKVGGYKKLFCHFHRGCPFIPLQIAVKTRFPYFKMDKQVCFKKTSWEFFLRFFSFISVFVKSLVGKRRTVVHLFKLEIEQFTCSHPYNPRRHHCHTLRDINERWRSKYDVLSHISFCFLCSLVLLNGAEQINGFCVRARPPPKKSYNKRMPSKPGHGHTRTDFVQRPAAYIDKDFCIGKQ